LKKCGLFLVLACVLLTWMPVLSAIANNNNTIVPAASPDSTQPGPHAVASAEYRFPAAVDTDVLSDRQTEIWAKVFYPKDTVNTQDKAPLIIMLHGNHATCGIGSNPRSDSSCSYTYTGICPTGYVPVPNHEGYDYLASNLASWGYWVASINANRGITCGGGVVGDGGLNLARGRLVLKHLSLFYKWATKGGAPVSLGLGSDGLIGKIDFTAVGLFGHSRGGEGVRAAYNLYLDQDSPWPAKIPGLSIKAIFEIGAVDGQTSRVLDANGTVWNQLLPMCDGDVSDLEGRYPFERMLLNKSELPNAQKSLYQVWGANHNFFNTEWQSTDSYGCYAGTPIFDKYGSSSLQQQKIALASVPAFFRSRLGSGANPSFNQSFNPLDFLPSVVTDITQVDRDFTPSPGLKDTGIVEDFDQKTGTNSSGNQNSSSQIDIEHQGLNDPQRAAALSWHVPGRATFFEAVWASPAEGQDIHDFATLDFRISRKSDALNTTPTTDFGIALEEASGLFSKEVRLADYATLNGPGNSNTILKTVRIPLSAFQGIDLTKVHGVRFIFDYSTSGALYFANIRVHRNFGLGKAEKARVARSLLLASIAQSATKPLPVYVPANLNSIRSVHIVKTSLALSGQPAVEIRVASQVPFPAMDRLPVLKVGKKEFTLSRYSDPDALKELTFTLTEKEYQSLSRTGEVTLSNGKIWKFGTLAKWLK
jgi:hypothetical protein